MRIVQQLVSPDQAQLWLDAMNANRKLRPSIVRKYAADMVAGAWRHDTPECITINTDGQMIDGQHRCRAIVSIGVSVLISVCYDATVVYDRGLMRGTQDTARIVLGRHVTPDAITITKGMFLRTKCSFSDYEVLARYDAYSDAIDFAVQHRVRLQRLGRISVWGAFARSYYHEDHDRLIDFTGVLGTGISRGSGDTAAIRLRDNLLKLSYNRTEEYQYTERAIHAFCARKPLSRLYAADHEMYPLPLQGAIEGE